MSAQNGSARAPAQFFDQVLIGPGGENGRPRSPLEQLFAAHAPEILPTLQPQATPEVPVRAIPVNGPALPTARPAAPEPVSDLTSAADLAAEYEWLREERKRLEAYTLNQFNLISRQREELAARRAEVEAAFALREQELNRQMKLIAERTESVEHREHQLARAEAEWELQLQKMASAEQQIQALEQTGAKLHKSIEQQRVVLEHLRLQSGQLQEAARAAEAEMLAFERAAQNRKRESDDEKARFEAQRQQLEKRFLRVEQVEEALRRREAELEELEVHLRCEIEQHEQQLAADQLELDKIRDKVRQQNRFDGN